MAAPEMFERLQKSRRVSARDTKTRNPRRPHEELHLILRVQLRGFRVFVSLRVSSVSAEACELSGCIWCARRNAYPTAFADTRGPQYAADRIAEQRIRSAGNTCGPTRLCHPPFALPTANLRPSHGDNCNPRTPPRDPDRTVDSSSPARRSRPPRRAAYHPPRPRRPHLSFPPRPLAPPASPPLTQP